MEMKFKSNTSLLEVENIREAIINGDIKLELNGMFILDEDGNDVTSELDDTDIMKEIFGTL